MEEWGKFSELRAKQKELNGKEFLERVFHLCTCYAPSAGRTPHKPPSIFFLLSRGRRKIQFKDERAKEGTTERPNERPLKIKTAPSPPSLYEVIRRLMGSGTDRVGSSDRERKNLLIMVAARCAYENENREGISRARDHELRSRVEMGEG